MKKVFPTLIDSDAIGQDTIFFSAGKIGLQIEMNPEDLKKDIRSDYANLKKEA